LIEFTHRATSGLSLVLVATLLIWAWRRTARGEWSRYSAAAATILLFNEALLGAMLVVFEHVGMDRSASRAVFLSLHFGNTLLLVAALTLSAKWLSNSARRSHFAGLTENTIRGHRSYMGNLKAFFGDRKLEDITVSLVETYRDERRQQAARNSPETKRHYQLGMAEQVRQAVEKTNKRLYGKRAPLHFRDSLPQKGEEEKIAVCK